MTNKLKKLAGASAVVIAAMGVTPVFAAGTDAGSTITNVATVSYTVGTVVQTPIVDDDVITVDRKVNLVVTEVGSSTTSVVPGQTEAVTTFTVQNTSNATIDIGLSAAQLSGGAAPFAGGNDNFDISSLAIWRETNGTAGFQSGVGGDTLLTAGNQYLDEVAEDGIATIYIVGGVDLAQVNDDIAVVSLTGTAKAPGATGTEGAALTSTAGANTAGMDTVLADAQGTDDASTPDGKHSARDDYKVSAPVLTVSKISWVIEDPINGTTNPKMIPGATIGYCITVSNATGGASATSVSISDPVPGQVLYTASSAQVVSSGPSGSPATCSGTGAGGSYAGTTVTGALGTVTSGSSKSLWFTGVIQ
jgi:uncharacterized repeat protein (TIGR01451 family)